jgi:ribosome maturation factor RimP
MSKIEKEIAKAVGVDPKRGEDRQDYLVRLLAATAKAADDAWNGLSKGAQTWYNDAAEQRNKDKKGGKPDADVLPFPDAEEEKEDKPARRRDADKDEDKDEKVKYEEGMKVKITNKRGKVYEGKVVEVTKSSVVVKGEDGEDEIDFDRIESSEIFHGDAKPSRGRDKDEEVEDPIKIGVTVEIVTARGKEYKGKIVELDKEGLAVKTEDGVEDLLHERIKSIKVVKAGKDEEEDKPVRRGSSSKDDDKGDAKEDKTARSSNPAGVSIGQRIKELICDDLEATQEDIAKALKKEDIAFKENTLNLNYVDCHKLIAILKKKKMLK